MHPELALLSRNVVAVGLVRPGAPEDVADRIVHVDLLHIMQIENLETAHPSASF
ncbi:MAG: hypothetical protein ACLP7Q_26055 [Isosphaeraceae bacterium]